MPLGLSIGSAFQASSAAAAAIEDYFFEVGVGGFVPLADPLSDNSDIWDLDSDGNIMPASVPKAEGYFELDSSGDITTIDIS